MSSLMLRNCRLLVTWSPKRGVAVYEHVDVLVEDGVIAAVGDHVEAPRSVEVVDCSRHMVVPGLVNAHFHPLASVLRRVSSSPREGGLTPEAAEAVAMMACAEMVSSGVTSFVGLGPCPEAVARAASSVGLRARIGPLVDPSGARPSLDRLVRSISGLRRVGIVVGVKPYVDPDRDALASLVDEVERLGASVHVDCSLTLADALRLRQVSGCTPVEYLDRLGLLRPGAVIAHACWLTKRDVELLASRRCRLVLCPSSAMARGARGFTPVYELERRGVVMALGAGGDEELPLGADLLAEMRQVVLLYRHAYWDLRLTAEHAFKYATVGGYEVLGVRGGLIAPGALGDLVVLSLERPWARPATRLNALSLLAYTMSGADVEYTVVEGEVVYDRQHAEGLWDAVERALKTLASHVA